MAVSFPTDNNDSVARNNTDTNDKPTIAVEEYMNPADRDAARQAEEIRTQGTDVDAVLGGADEFAIVDAQAQHSRWAVAIDLTATIDPPGTDQMLGAEVKVERLLEFADRTEGSDLTLVVQATGLDGNVDRYVIRDGQVEHVHHGASEGMQDNLDALLETAEQYAPAEHLGLILQSHGAGANGINAGPGGSGSLSLGELEQTIRQSLERTGRDALDFLNFDSCSMGDYSVIDAVAQVAQNIIASQETEGACTATVDGQNLEAVFERALNDPDLTADSFAQHFVDAAEAGEHGAATSVGDEADVNCQGVSTLAVFNTEAEPQFEAALNHLGTELASLVKEDPSALEALGLDISGSQSLPVRAREVAIPTSQRDLAQFLEHLKASILSGEINDADGSLTAAIDGVAGASEALITGFYGSGEMYSAMGGLSVFLPQPELFSGERRARHMAQSMVENFEQFPNRRDEFPSQEVLLQVYEQSAANVVHWLTSGERGNEQTERLEQLVREAEDLDMAGLAAHSQAFAEALRQFHQSDLGAAFSERMTLAQRRVIDAQVQSEIPPTYTGWGEFINALAPAGGLIVRGAALE
jgi:hypothetical protein